MTRKSKREIERRIEDLSDSEESRFKDVWIASAKDEEKRTEQEQRMLDVFEDQENLSDCELARYPWFGTGRHHDST
ncbi:hypothetical protein RBH20_09725 [Haloarcula sp. H-GB4]|uniref:hypothetical protein n=1 Tax=Haloarcula sp. H-GB4 TaxID=3069755 RepID=UPI0027ADC54E|nr:hypothetical protein [Haloarcula sp. H-GB4]MDQ2072812.1 hypothetical protein [Haloarcula sp. H-GB4]